MLLPVDNTLTKLPPQTVTHDEPGQFPRAFCAPNFH